jgi:hypothetical protein
MKLPVPGIDDIAKLEAAIDERPVPAYRVGSDPGIFNIAIKEENKLGPPLASIEPVQMDTGFFSSL